MPQKCSVSNCNGNYPNGPKVSVFSFPKDEDLKSKWIRAIDRKNFVPTHNTKVCQLHFREHEIERITSMFDEKNGRLLTAPLSKPRLVKDAVPSQFHTHLQYQYAESQDLRRLSIGEGNLYARDAEREKIHNEMKMEEEELENLDDEISPGMTILAEAALNFEGMCRLCMKQEKQMTDIFTERNSLPMKLGHIIPHVKISAGDGLPSQICRACVQHTHITHHFLTQCEVSDSIFRKYLNKQIIIYGNTELWPIVDIKQEEPEDENSSTLRISSTFSLRTDNLSSDVDEMEGFSQDTTDNSNTESQNLESCSAKERREKNINKPVLKLQSRKISRHVRKNACLNKPRKLQQGYIPSVATPLDSEQVKKSSRLQKTREKATKQPVIMLQENSNKSSVTNSMLFLSSMKQTMTSKSYTKQISVKFQQPSSDSATITHPTAVSQKHKNILTINSCNRSPRNTKLR